MELLAALKTILTIIEMARPLVKKAGAFLRRHIGKQILLPPRKEAHEPRLDFLQLDDPFQYEHFIQRAMDYHSDHPRRERRAMVAAEERRLQGLLEAHRADPQNPFASALLLNNLRDPGAGVYWHGGKG